MRCVCYAIHPCTIAFENPELGCEFIIRWVWDSFRIISDAELIISQYLSRSEKNTIGYSSSPSITMPISNGPGQRSFAGCCIHLYDGRTNFLMKLCLSSAWYPGLTRSGPGETVILSRKLGTVCVEPITNYHHKMVKDTVSNGITDACD